MCPDSLPPPEVFDKSNIFAESTWRRIVSKLSLKKKPMIFHIIGAIHNAEIQALESLGVGVIIYEFRKNYLQHMDRGTVVEIDYDFDFPSRIENLDFVIITENGQAQWKLYNWIYQLCRNKIECNVFCDGTLLEVGGFEKVPIQIEKVCNLSLHYDPEEKRDFFELQLSRYFLFTLLTLLIIFFY